MPNNIELDPKIVSIENKKPDLRKKEEPLVDIKITNPLTYIILVEKGHRK